MEDLSLIILEDIFLPVSLPKVETGMDLVILTEEIQVRQVLLSLHYQKPERKEQLITLSASPVIAENSAAHAQLEVISMTIHLDHVYHA